MRDRRRSAVFACLAAVAALVASGTAVAADWVAEQPGPPPGHPFSGALGTPGDLSFWAPNRGLLTVAGNGAYERGVLVYDGTGWRQYATVCGADGASGGEARIAWAGPTEFWTIARPSALQAPTNEGAVTLCRFRDGKVEASYASALTGNEPWPEMNAAACRSVADCLFAGPVARTVDGARSGAFHLRWDGQVLSTLYAPQGRAVTDLLAAGDGYFESVTVGPSLLSTESGRPLTPEPVPLLLHRAAGAEISTDPFEPLPAEELPSDGSELLALDSEGDQVWAGGGQATSGPNALIFSGGRRPLLARRVADGPMQEIALPQDAFAPGESIVDLASVPGTDRVWAAVAQYPPSPDEAAKVALIDASGAVLRTALLPEDGPRQGAAARVDCPAAGECWMVTVSGWLFHLREGDAPAPDLEPAFATRITTRPADVRTPQFTPDALPVDDSQRNAPPPPPPPAAAAPPAKTQRLAKLVTVLRSGLRKGTSTFEVRIKLARRARVGLVAERRSGRGKRARKRVVARLRTRTLRAGRHTLRLRFERRRWPTGLRFVLRELDPRLQAPSAGADDTITVGDGAADAPPTSIG